MAMPGLNRRSAGRHGQRQLGQPGDEPAQGLLKLHPGKLGTEAVVGAGAEAQVAERSTAEPE
jgi:hypothetical protein